MNFDAVDALMQEEQDFTSYIQWGRLITKDGHLISSNIAGGSRYYSRCNSNIVVIHGRGVN